MKKLLSLIAFLAILACNPAWSDTTTPFYAMTEPSINSISWGVQMNTNLSTIDTNLWAASSGTVIGINAPSASGSNIILTNPIDKIQDLAFTTTGLSVQLPAMNAQKSPVAGGSFSIKNVGTPAFGILAADGSTVIVSTIMAGQQVSLTPLSDSTTNGTFSVSGPYISSIGTVFLGSSTTGTSPAINGDNTTGFYTPSAGNIAAAISGTETWLLNNTGESIIGNISPTGALDFTGTSAATAGITGVHSTTGNSLSLETTGHDALTITSTQSIGIGTSAPTSTLTVAGSFNATGSTTLAGVQYPTTNGTNLQFLQTNGSGTANWASTRGSLQFGAGTAQGSGGNTYYLGSSCIGTSGECPAVVPFDGTLKNMVVGVSLPPGTGNTVIATLYINGSAGNETCTISGSSSGLCQDTTNVDVISAESDVQIALTWSTTASTAYVFGGVEFDNP